MPQPPAVVLRKEQAARPPPPPPPPAPPVVAAPPPPPPPPAAAPPRAEVAAAAGAVAVEPSEPEFVVGVTLNVSSTAVPGDSAGTPPALLLALHALFTQGFLLDATTGAVSLLDPRVTHAVFIELPALESWPADGDNFSVTQHPFLANGLPALNSAFTAAFAVSNRSVPFAVGKEERVVAAVVRALLDGDSAALGAATNLGAGEDVTLLRENRATGRPYNAAEIELANESVRRTLDELWALGACKGIPRSKLARRRFVLLLHDRVKFIYDVRRALVMSTFGVPGSTASLLARTAKAIGPSFYDRLSLILLAEAINLCDESMRRDWGNSRREVVWTVRDQTRVQAGTSKDVGLALVCLYAGISAADIAAAAPPLPRGGLRAFAATKSLNDARMLLSGLRTFSTLKADFDRVPEPGTQPAVPLSAHLAPAFGLDDPARLKRILDAAGYVMSNGGWPLGPRS